MIVQQLRFIRNFGDGLGLWVPPKRRRNETRRDHASRRPASPHLTVEHEISSLRHTRPHPVEELTKCIRKRCLLVSLVDSMRYMTFQGEREAYDCDPVIVNLHGIS